jgi:CheY-like chemotaxis protein
MSLPVLPKILYIEGHATVRDVTCQLLGLRAEFEIQTTGNGLDGIHLAESWQPDLILLGLRLPRLDGFATIAELRRRPATAHTPIIVLSAWDSANHRQRTDLAGASAHFSLPIETERLVAAIRRLLPTQQSKGAGV